MNINNLNPQTNQGKKIKIAMIKQKLKNEMNDSQKQVLEEELFSLTNELASQPAFLNPRLSWIHQ